MDLLTIRYFIRYNFREKTQKEIADFQLFFKVFNLQNMKSETQDKTFEDFYKPRFHLLGKEYKVETDVSKSLEDTEKFYKDKIEDNKTTYSEAYGYKAALKRALEEKQKELLEQSENKENN
jgi:hypothetical protein